MNFQHLTQTLVDSFNALADEVQALTDRKTVLEHKLRFAHEQVRNWKCIILQPLPSFNDDFNLALDQECCAAAMIDILYQRRLIRHATVFLTSIDRAFCSLDKR
jgi:hypothetical protein